MPESLAGGVLTLEVEREGESAVVRCSGRLVSSTQGEFYARVKELIPGSKVLTLDLQELSHTDSMGLGCLVRLYSSARSAGCELKLVHLGKQLMNLLRITHLLNVLAVAEDSGAHIA